MKRALSLLLAVCILCSCIPLPILADEEPSTPSPTLEPTTEGPIIPVDQLGLDSAGENEDEVLIPPDSSEDEPERPENESSNPNIEDETMQEEAEAEAALAGGTATYEQLLFLIDHIPFWSAPLYCELVQQLTAFSPKDNSFRQFAGPLLERIRAAAVENSYGQMDLLSSAIDELRYEMQKAAALEQLAALQSRSMTAAAFLRMTAAERSNFLRLQQDTADALALLNAEDIPAYAASLLVSPLHLHTLHWAGEGSQWTITADNGSYLYPSSNPYAATPISVRLENILGDLVLSSDGSYLTFDTSLPSPFGTSTDSTDAVPLLLLRPSDSSDGWLDGYSRLTEPGQLYDGLSVLVCMVSANAEGVFTLYLIDPSEPASHSPIKTVSWDNPVQPLEESPPSSTATIPGTPPIGSSTPIELAVEATATQKQTLEWTQHGILFASEEEKKTVSIPADSPIAQITFPIQQAMRWDSGTYSATKKNSLVSLDSCSYQLLERCIENEKTYFYVCGTDADGNAQYLKFHDAATDSGYVNTHNYQETVPIRFEQNDGGFRIIGRKNDGSECKLYFATSWGVFINDTYKNAHSTQTSYSDTFYLFRQADFGYYPVTSADDIKAGGRYLIAVNAGNGAAKTLLMYPATSEEYSSSQGDKSRNANVAGVDKNILIPSEYSSTVTFTALSLGKADFQLGNQSSFYHIQVVDNGSLDTLPALQEPPSSIEQTATLLGGSVTITHYGDALTEEQIEISPTPEPLNKGNVSFEILSHAENDTFAQLGSDGNYNGERIPLESCLYHFSGSAGSYTISHTEGGTTSYLNISKHGIVNSSTPAVFTVTPWTNSKSADEPDAQADGEEDVRFRLHQDDTVGDLYFWGWKLFTNSNSSYVVNQTQMDGTSRILLYRRTLPGEESCSELKGYQRVTTVPGEGEYLIAVVYNHQMYFVHPSASTSSTNAHVAKRTTEWAPSATEIRYTGTDVGKVNVIKKDNRDIILRIDIIEKPEDISIPTDKSIFLVGSGAGLGQRLDELIISTGASFQISLSPDYSCMLWNSSNGALVNVDQNGFLTVADPDNMPNQSQQYVDIYALLTPKNGGGSPVFYKLKVTVIKNSYEETRVFNQYVGELVHTEVYMSYPQKGVTDYGPQYYNFLPVSQYQSSYLYRDVRQEWGLHYFARPENGYALYYMNAEGSAGNYLMLDDVNAANTEYYQNGPCPTQRGIYGNEVIGSMLQYAIDIGCVGAMGFTGHLNDHRSITNVVAFRSAKLPTIENEVAYVLPSDKLETFKGNVKVSTNPDLSAFSTYEYTHSQPVQEGHAVIFAVTVDDTEGTDDITYHSLDLMESLPGAKFISSEEDSLNILHYYQSSGAGLRNKLTFYMYYTITEQDAVNYQNGIALVSNVSLRSNFKTRYESSSMNATSESNAVLTVSIASYLSYVNLSLDQGIRANVYVQKNDITDSWYNDEHYLVFQLDDASTYPIRIPYSRGEADIVARFLNQDYRRFSMNLAPQYMTTQISVCIENSKGIQLTDSLNFTVQEYANSILDVAAYGVNEWTIQEGTKEAATSYYAYDLAKLKTLLNAVLEFGKQTQCYMNYKTENLAAPGAGYSPTSFGDIAVSEQRWYSITDGHNGITFTGAALEIGGTNPGIRVYFKADQRLNLSDSKGVSGYVDSLNGQFYEFSQVSEIQAAGFGEYYVSIPSIPPTRLNTVYTVSILRDGKTTSIALYPMAYVYLAKKSTAPIDEKLQNLIAAVYDYNNAATDYFQPAAAAKFAIG